jgi:hypothetical protein
VFIKQLCPSKFGDAPCDFSHACRPTATLRMILPASRTFLPSRCGFPESGESAATSILVLVTGSVRRCTELSPSLHGLLRTSRSSRSSIREVRGRLPESEILQHCYGIPSEHASQSACNRYGNSCAHGMQARKALHHHCRARVYIAIATLNAGYVRYQNRFSNIGAGECSQSHMSPDLGPT